MCAESPAGFSGATRTRRDSVRHHFDGPIGQRRVELGRPSRRHDENIGEVERRFDFRKVRDQVMRHEAFVDVPNCGDALFVSRAHGRPHHQGIGDHDIEIGRKARRVPPDPGALTSRAPEKSPRQFAAAHPRSARTPPSPVSGPRPRPPSRCA